MRTVAVAGIGKTRFGALSDMTLRDLGARAVRDAISDAGVNALDIEAFYLGNFAGPAFIGQNHLAPYVAGHAGLNNIPCTRIENACASSGSAFFQGWLAVASGAYDVVLVAGVEKMTSQATSRVTEILAEAGDMNTEGVAGATFPALFAMIANRHMHQYGTTREQLAAVAVKNHSNGALNPAAHMRKVITLEQALAGRMVAEPLTLYDCSLVSDGAAAVVLLAQSKAAQYTSRAITVRAVAQASDHLALEEKPDITTMHATVTAAREAYARAGVGPENIDLAEVHDCFTIAEIVATEDLGFVAKGEGGPFAGAGKTTLSGSLPVNTSGGLKAKGHPVGATGVGQICDLVMQLRGDAGPRQVARHNVGLAQNLGGSGATSVVTILSVS